MRIRREQMAAFEDAVLRSFQDEMLEHLKQFAPKHCEVIGDERVREVIALGIQRAEKCGLTNRGPIRFYLEMMFLFGSDFDTDPQYPWAAAILKDASTPDQMARAERLYEKMKDYFAHVGGPESKYVLDAMRAIRHASPDQFTFSPGGLRSTMLGELKRFYPQKCQHLGDPPLEALIRCGVETAKEYSITADRSVAVFVAMMFAIGHRFAADPQYPWAAKALAGNGDADPSQRAERLVVKAMIYLDAALNNVEPR